MKTKFTVKHACMAAAIFLAGGAWAQQVQQDGEPIQAAGELPLGGFGGCKMEPPKDSCQARIKCHGVGTIYTKSPISIQNATKEASMNARKELAQFYSNRTKAAEAVTNASKSSAASNADGGSSNTEVNTREMSDIFGSSTEAILSGVQVLGRQIDMNMMAVTVKIGVSCKSQGAAAQSQAAAARSANVGAAAAAQPQQPQGPTGAAYNSGPVNLKSVNQKVKNADDF